MTDPFDKLPRVYATMERLFPLGIDGNWEKRNRYCNMILRAFHNDCVRYEPIHQAEHKRMCEIAMGIYNN